MTRVKRGVIKQKRRKNVLAQTKGYRFGRSTKEAQAREAIHKAGAHAFAHRKDKKSDRRALNQTKISAAATPLKLSYSKFIGALKAKGAIIDRKILADIAKNNPETFERIVEAIK